MGLGRGRPQQTKTAQKSELQQCTLRLAGCWLAPAGVADRARNYDRKYPRLAKFGRQHTHRPSARAQATFWLFERTSPIRLLVADRAMFSRHAFPPRRDRGEGREQDIFACVRGLDLHYRGICRRVTAAHRLPQGIVLTLSPPALLFAHVAANRGSPAPGW